MIGEYGKFRKKLSIIAYRKMGTEDRIVVV